MTAKKPADVTVTAPGGEDLETRLAADLKASAEQRRADAGDPELEALLKAKEAEDLKPLPTNYAADIAVLASEHEALDLTVGELWDRIDRLELVSKRETALRGAVALHAAISYRSHSSNIDKGVTDTADTLLAWLVSE